MDIRIQITDSDNELKYKAEKALNIYLEKLIAEKMKSIDLDALISKRLEYLIDRSKYVSDSVIRNLVQQKIARELTNKIFSNET